MTLLLRRAVLLVSCLAACRPSPSKVNTTLTPSSELVEQTRAVYAAMTAGSAPQVEALYSLAPGSVFVGSGAAEFWTDPARHNADVRPYWQPGNVTVTAGAIHAVVQGEMGFSVDRPTFRLRDGTTLQLRVTFVWHREAGTWKVVHSHASVGASS